MIIVFDEFALLEKWEEIKEILSQINSGVVLDDKPSWFTPKKLMLKSQVDYRKHLMVRARSCC